MRCSWSQLMVPAPAGGLDNAGTMTGGPSLSGRRGVSALNNIMTAPGPARSHTGLPIMPRARPWPTSNATLSAGLARQVSHKASSCQQGHHGDADNTNINATNFLGDIYNARNHYIESWANDPLVIPGNVIVLLVACKSDEQLIMSSHSQDAMLLI